MMEFRTVAENELATARLGADLAAILPGGTVIALVGPLGAGKTRFVQGFATALGVGQEQVTSPTFVLVNEYLDGSLPIYHLDTYRLPSTDEFIELGPEEYFNSEGVTLVEWADRVTDCLPEDYLTVRIDVLSEASREIIVTGSTTALDPLLEKLHARVNAADQPGSQ
ncbi:MAG: tRNA (adenosine(37)-N6)-threonylcarbamoyltransferase complex ATPase subunit type 1 TsaE [Pirellulales bacterium]|nr:tRNA (adenosine(37)-N6)-threonylcarbamoyltransferase complex ATPase subunit type 1 TsaE [Pirellulales bacterium]